MNKRGGGVSRFSVGNFLSQSVEKFRRGSLYCCNNFRCRKNSDKSWGEYQDFSWKTFCLTVPKNFVGASFTVAFFLGVEKVWIRGEGGGGASRFSVEIFLSHSAENLSTVESFSVWLISGIEKFYAAEGYVTIFKRLFCLTVPKIFVGEYFCAVFQKNSGCEKVYG